MNFGNVLTAMVTPFDSKGNVDYQQTTVLIDYLLNNGTEGLVVAGTTGESPTLTTEEKVNLFRHVVKAADKRVPVIAGTGSNNTSASIALTKEAEACGVDAVMLVTPYYNKPNQAGLYEHFKDIANATKLPVMLYNIPGRSVVKMSAETIIRLSEIENIVSVKEASGDLDQIAEVVEQTNEDFSVYSGEDGLTLPMLAVGATGVISVASHIIGNEIGEMIQAFNKGDVKKAASIHRRVLPIMNGLFMSPSPVPVKTALQMKGIEAGPVRLPLVPLTQLEQKTLKELIER
ncbi:4-hydroxy-tetrahydrodipicolinate synthase [Virgibacillus dakarensis]|uniref:4-hydroxy-tetrahydrodipicolinate synthase n=1 Tax=Lentibacillus populi TaxID=1827502 RepID=A0A9W5X3X5_9BACI|nr:MULTISPECIES: 4-hydroxy-tetrahydrodipicolinate synthase [Bacillaceae]MTW84927.1 4-hydroxy-tetrahydrodipicolinate synthase [Virgibacillus dakarensis]GGB30754.1 4-hydroxy-tetrahydrodipicolinate synthase [Lentibacillus populi]